MMETVVLKGPGQSEVVIYYFGAHVTSWKNAAGRQMIYTSPTALYDGSKAIRGGIPVCFPQFAKNGPLKQHGFARNMTWSPDPSFNTDGKNVAQFVLTDTEATRASQWPHMFQLALRVELSLDGNSLTVTMNVKNANTNDQAFTFTTALHSYFTCEAESVILSDYDGVSYMDNTDPEQPEAHKIQTGNITFGKEVDRVFLNTKNTLSIPQAGLTLEKENFPEAVVWNPCIEKAAALSDMPDDDWKNFICIEPARVVEPAVVKPGDEWTGTLKLISTT